MVLSRLSNSSYGAVVRSSTYKPWVSGISLLKSVKESSIVHLIDPITDDQLLIVGTSNISTSLAYHNLRAAEKFEPTSVLLQVSPTFENYINGTFASSEEFQDYLVESDYYTKNNRVYSYGPRNALAEWRKLLLASFIKNTLVTPSDVWRLFTPGIDTKLILELGNKLGSQIVYVGEDFDEKTNEGLRNSSRMDAIYPFFNYHLLLNDLWRYEAKALKTLFLSHSLKSIVEGHLNNDHVTWAVKFAEKLIPNQKKIVIDKRDEDIFWKIEKKMKGNRKLVLVNKWHLDGVQKFWRTYRGLDPKKQYLSLHDLPLEEIQAWFRGKDLDRKIVVERTGFPMALPHSREITGYADENRSHFA